MLPIKTILLIVGVCVAVVAGILFALGRMNGAPTGGPINPTAISEILVGVRSGENIMDPANPHIRQKDSYGAGEPIMVRVTTTNAVSAPYTLSARLLTQNRTVIPLNPGQVTLQPGTSTFCCWTIEEAGQYTLQLFRPEGVITGVPLTITQVNEGQRPPQLLR
ncbi:MAG: hypothetical protein WEC84_00305 [Candidatus Andersenbacteria bacterium]